MLEKVGVKVLVETILEFDGGGLPNDFVSERDDCTFFQFDFVLRSEIDVDNLLPVVPDFELFVSENVVFTALSNFSHHTPDGQIIKVHLVPVVILHGIGEGLQLFIIQLYFTVRSI